MNDEPRHPGAQTMAAFFDGTLPAAEVATVASHLRECSECRTVVGETARFEREDEARTRRSPLISRAWWLAAAAILAMAVIGIPLLRVQLARTSDPIARLIEAVPRDHRLVEPRLAGFRWARLQSSARGSAAVDPADLKLTGAAGDVLEKTLDRRDPAGDHAKGVAYLLIGRTTESIASLEQSAQRANDWRVWNDLAAARYALAIDGKSPSQLPEALASADRALRLQPDTPEALFNRALILEALGVKDQARRAWKQYLAADPSSAWSNEAREHLRQLERPVARFDPKLLGVMPVDELVRPFPYETRRHAELLLLAGWADAAWSHEDAKAAALLARAHAVGDALVRLRSEHLLAGSVAAIEGAGPGARTALIDGHRLYRDARAAFKRGQATDAEKPFRDSAVLLARGGSPMAQLAEYYAATTAFNQHRADDARRELTDLLARVDAARYHALRGEIVRQLAVCANADGDWGSAARYADEAANLFRSLGERSYAADADGIAAMAVEMIGESDRAWQRRLGVFAEISNGGDTSRLSTNVHMAASTLAAIGHAAAAASMVHLLADEGALDPGRASFSSADDARYASRSGDRAGAQEALARARASVQRVTDLQLREWINAQIELAGATGDSDPRRAIAALDRSIDYFAKGETQIDLPDAYLQRARAKHAAGDEDASLADYAAALHAMEDQRSTLHDGEWRLQFLDVATQIIEETIDRRLAHGDVAGAFAVADRARMLIDPQPIDVASAGALPALPPGVVVIEYALLPRRIVAFCISNGSVAAESVEIDRGELEQRIAAFTERIRRRGPVDELRADSAALYQLLIAPLQRHLPGARELVLIPDRQLYAVPFAALWNAAPKQYLVEEFTLRLAPSASFRRDLTRTSANGAALVIADPSTTSPPLPASRKEASAIAAMYGTALLAGEEATRDAFVEAARRSTLIHFAGHANSDAMLSHGALLLAAAGGDSGILDSSEVARLRLERNPLVLLAACGTFRGDALHVAGMSSLSRSFLVAGARGVVGTLWEIDDDVSASLFLRVHEHLRAGLAPADALRAAQIDMLHSPDPRLSHLATWAPAELLTDV
jgi:CHAT domain-containing protein/tetratricopeptide (TPR) repeat protein